MKIYTQTTYIIAVFISALLGNTASVYADTNLKSSLLNMGYEGIRVEACKLKFARKFTPKTENNNGFAYEQFIDLNSLKEFDKAPIEKWKSGKTTTYALLAEFNDGYYEIYRNVFSFKRFVRNNHPNSNWPYVHSKFHDEFVTVLEYEMRQRMPMYQSMNRYVMYSKFGASTDFEKSFLLTYDDSESLKEVKQAVIDYSIKNNCGILNFRTEPPPTKVEGFSVLERLRRNFGLFSD